MTAYGTIFDWRQSTNVEALLEYFCGLEDAGQDVDAFLEHLEELEDLVEQIQNEQLEQSVRHTRELLGDLEKYFASKGMRVAVRVQTLLRQLEQNSVFSVMERDEVTIARNEEEQAKRRLYERRRAKREIFDKLNGEQCRFCGAPVRLFEGRESGNLFLGCERWLHCSYRPSFRTHHRSLLKDVGLA